MCGDAGPVRSCWASYFFRSAGRPPLEALLGPPGFAGLRLPPLLGPCWPLGFACRLVRGFPASACPPLAWGLGAACLRPLRAGFGHGPWRRGVLFGSRMSSLALGLGLVFFFCVCGFFFFFFGCSPFSFGSCWCFVPSSCLCSRLLCSLLLPWACLCFRLPCSVLLPWACAPCSLLVVCSSPPLPFWFVCVFCSFFFALRLGVCCCSASLFAPCRPARWAAGSPALLRSPHPAGARGPPLVPPRFPRGPGRAPGRRCPPRRLASSEKPTCVGPRTCLLRRGSLWWRSWVRAAAWAVPWVPLPLTPGLASRGCCLTRRRASSVPRCVSPGPLWCALALAGSPPPPFFGPCVPPGSRPAPVRCGRWPWRLFFFVGCLFCLLCLPRVWGFCVCALAVAVFWFPLAVLLFGGWLRVFCCWRLCLGAWWSVVVGWCLLVCFGPCWPVLSLAGAGWCCVVLLCAVLCAPLLFLFVLCLFPFLLFSCCCLSPGKLFLFSCSKRFSC